MAVKDELLSLMEKAISKEVDLITFAKEYEKLSYENRDAIKEDKDFEALRDLKSHCGFFSRQWDNNGLNNNGCSGSCCHNGDELKAEFYDNILDTHKKINS